MTWPQDQKNHNTYIFLFFEPFLTLGVFYDELLSVEWWKHNTSKEALVWWLWEETQVLKVVGSNPITIYWMDIFHVDFVFAWKDVSKNEKDSYKQILESGSCTMPK